jgi:hypothetical protein
MNREKKLSQPMYNLLITNNLNDFTVTQARDQLQKTEYAFSDGVAARKFIYCQLLRLVATGFLHASGENREKKYKKTNLFNQFVFASKPVKKRKSDKIDDTNTVLLEEPKSEIKASLLKKECNEIQANLAVSLAEIDEYRDLMNRFPEAKNLLATVFRQEKERSVKLLAQLNTRTYLLNALQVQVGAKC